MLQSLKGHLSMDILATSLDVLVKDWNGIFGILGIFLLGSGIAILWIRTVFDADLTSGELFALGVGGGLLPLFLGIFLTVLLDFLFGIKINFIAPCLVILIISGFASYRSGRGQISLLLEQYKTAGFKQRISAIFTPPFKVAPALVLFLF